MNKNPKTVRQLLIESGIRNGEYMVAGIAGVPTAEQFLDHYVPLLEDYIEGIINTSKEVYIVKGKEAESERYCEIREELRQEQLKAAGLSYEK